MRRVVAHPNLKWWAAQNQLWARRSHSRQESAFRSYSRQRVDNVVGPNLKGPRSGERSYFLSTFWRTSLRRGSQETPVAAQMVYDGGMIIFVRGILGVMRNHNVALILAIACLVGGVARVVGNDQPVQNLGADRFAERQAAMRQLWASPEAARKAVEQAERDGDAEMAARARWILRQWKQGLTPDTPLDVRRSLQAAVKPPIRKNCSIYFTQVCPIRC